MRTILLRKLHKHINPYRSLTFWWMGHLCSQGWTEFYTMCLGVYPIHTLWLIGLAHNYNLEEPKLPPGPLRMRKMPVAFINYTSLQGFPCHWEGGEYSYASSISCLLFVPLLSFTPLPDCNPNFCFKSDYQGKNLLVEFLCGSCWMWDLERIWHVASLILFEWYMKHAQRCFRLFQEHTYQDSLGHDIYLCIQVKMVCVFSSLMSSPGSWC